MKGGVSVFGEKRYAPQSILILRCMNEKMDMFNPEERVLFQGDQRRYRPMRWVSSITCPSMAIINWALVKPGFKRKDRIQSIQLKKIAVFPFRGTGPPVSDFLKSFIPWSPPPLDLAFGQNALGQSLDLKGRL